MEVLAQRLRALAEHGHPYPGGHVAPVARLVKASLERGLYLMTHWNVIMVVPPLTITRDEVDEGLAILDETLAIADEYVA